MSEVKRKEKSCSKCGEVLPLGMFYADRRRADGHKASCKTCCVTPAQRAAWESAYRRRHPEVAAEANRRYRRANPSVMSREVRPAHRELHNALRRGEIVRPLSCERCGRACTPHGHHADYSKSLSVEWLCRSCHTKEHAK